jgi:hypothetical protein
LTENSINIVHVLGVQRQYNGALEAGMSKVAQLKIVPKYNPQVVDILTTMLEQAKCGEIVELVSTTKCADGSYDHCWTGCENLMELAGILERQKLNVLRRMDP